MDDIDDVGDGESPKNQNNNFVFTNTKSPEKRTNGVPEISNNSMVNTPDLSPLKTLKNEDAEDAEVRKMKVLSKIIFMYEKCCIKNVV